MVIFSVHFQVQSRFARLCAVGAAQTQIENGVVCFSGGHRLRLRRAGRDGRDGRDVGLLDVVVEVPVAAELDGAGSAAVRLSLAAVLHGQMYLNDVCEINEYMT